LEEAIRACGLWRSNPAAQVIPALSTVSTDCPARKEIQKMKAGLLPELGQMADKLKLVPTRCNAPEPYALRHTLFRAVGSF